VQDRTAAEVVQLTKDEGIEIIDIRFCDLPGLMQHFSVPAHELTEASFEEDSVSTDPPSAASRRSRNRTCSCSRTPRPPSSTPSASTRH